MKTNLFSRYFITHEGVIYDTKNNNERVRTRIRDKDRYKTAYLANGDKPPIERHVLRLVAQIYKPNPDNHYHCYFKNPSHVDLNDMLWCSLSDLRILNAGGTPEKKEKPKPNATNGGYPRKPIPEVRPNVASNLVWK